MLWGELQVACAWTASCAAGLLSDTVKFNRLSQTLHSLLTHTPLEALLHLWTSPGHCRLFFSCGPRSNV